jgi:hypothetical protein
MELGLDLALRLGSAALGGGAREPVYGPELVSNGSFATDTTGWNAVSGVASAVAGWGRLTSSASPAHLSQPITTEIGATYRVTGDWRSSAGTWRIVVGTTAGGNNLANPSSAASGSIDLTFVATGTTTYVAVRSVVITVGDYGEMDNVSIKKVT